MLQDISLTLGDVPLSRVQRSAHLPQLPRLYCRTTLYASAARVRNMDRYNAV